MAVFFYVLLNPYMFNITIVCSTHLVALSDAVSTKPYVLLYLVLFV